MTEEDNDIVDHGHLGRFEPPTETDEILSLLNQDRPWEAAQRLLKLEYCDRFFLSALADLIGGDVKVNPELATAYPYRLALVGGNRPGPKPKFLQYGLNAKHSLDPVASETNPLDQEFVGEKIETAFDPGFAGTEGSCDLPDTVAQRNASQPSEDIIALLAAGLTASAANKMRQLEFGSKPLLQTLADMIGSGAEGHSELVRTYSSRLVLKSWGIKGRKARPSSAKPKEHPGYVPQKTRLDLHRAGQMRRVADGTIGAETINIYSNKPTSISLARMVMRRMSRGMSCPEAVKEVAKDHFLSYGWVKRAYNTSKKLVNSVRSRPPLPPKTNSSGI